MKKIVFLIALLMTMCFSASAQFDSFITNDGFSNSNRDGGSDMPLIPGGSVGGVQDTNAPLGTGLLILTALGAGYAVKSRE